MSQLSLFDDIEPTSCPCGGSVTIADPVGPVAVCDRCSLAVIKDRGRWQDFRKYFGGGEKPTKRKRSRRAA